MTIELIGGPKDGDTVTVMPGALEFYVTLYQSGPTVFVPEPHPHAHMRLGVYRIDRNYGYWEGEE